MNPPGGCSDAPAPLTPMPGKATGHQGNDMHHLEPLSWDVGSASASFIARPQGAPNLGDVLISKRTVREELDHARSAFAAHAILRLILTFSRGVEQSVAPTSLAAIAHATVELARLEFALLEWDPWCGSRFRSDCKRCIAGLEELVVALSGNQALPTFALIHAMDTLIALLVQADGSRRSTCHTAS